MLLFLQLRINNGVATIITQHRKSVSPTLSHSRRLHQWHMNLNVQKLIFFKKLHNLLVQCTSVLVSSLRNLSFPLLSKNEASIELKTNSRIFFSLSLNLSTQNSRFSAVWPPKNGGSSEFTVRHNLLDRSSCIFAIN